MNYEQLLDEIMTNTIAAKELIDCPVGSFSYGISPRNLEFYSSIFLATSLLTFEHDSPIIFLIQQEELPEEVLIYNQKIWPHFGRQRHCGKNAKTKLDSFHFPSTEQNYYPYLDKLFAYLGVINTNQDHLVIFVRKDANNKLLTQALKQLIDQKYKLLVLSNAYENLPLLEGKTASEKLISRMENKKLSLEDKRNFAAMYQFSQLLPEKANPHAIKKLINTGELGLNTEQATNFCFLMH